MSASGATCDLGESGQLLELRLDAPRGNVIDAATMRALDGALARHGGDPRLMAILFTAAGENFSFGASVAEHTREQAPSMLASFHGLFHRLAELSVPTVAAVRGACLGGGLELVSWAGWIFASPGARFAQPEIKLGVFAPMASVLLPWRLGAGRAIDLCVSGRTLDAGEAHRVGLVHAVDDSPEEAARAFIREHLLPRSATSLRFAERAVRRGVLPLLGAHLASLERLYLDELMATPDASEGIAAFLERRPPRWSTP